jgi:hypothetical protein
LSLQKMSRGFRSPNKFNFRLGTDVIKVFTRSHNFSFQTDR